MKGRKEAILCVLLTVVLIFGTVLVSQASGPDYGNVEIEIDQENIETTELMAKSMEDSRAMVIEATKVSAEAVIAAEEEAARIAAEEERRARQADEDLLAALIFCEAGGEPYQGQVAVGAVVMNRVRSGRYPGTISGVVYQRGQFGPATTGKLGRVLASGRTTESCRQAARDAMAGVNPVGGATSFGDGVYSGIQIGAHWFH